MRRDVGADRDRPRGQRAALDPERQAARAPELLDPRPAGTQRRDERAHRPLPHPRAAVEDVPAGDRGEEREEEPRRSAGRTDVQEDLSRAPWRERAGDDPAVGPELDLRPERPERGREGARVVGIERRDDLAPARRERGRHERPVRQALRARDTEVPLDPAPRKPHAGKVLRTARAALGSSTKRKEPSGSISACRRSSSQAGRTRTRAPPPA